VANDAELEAGLRAIRASSDALIAAVASLSPAELDAPSNCPPWTVRGLVVHLIIGGAGFVASVRAGLAGSSEPTGADERAQREHELETADAASLAAALDAVTTESLDLYDGLDDDALAAICFHRRGNRPVRWYAMHRLAEVAFHSWDLQVSLGRRAQLPEAVAALLLATLLESNAPRTYAAGLTRERGTGERYAFAVAGDPSARRVVTIDPDRLSTARGDAAADLTITASAADLALVVYGRRDLRDSVRSGAVRLDGDLAYAERFELVFPRP
jgi:uncharacterized protein (TIGR03083 family)